MLVVVSCPECGHLGRVPEKRLGHKVRCTGCGVTFRPQTAASPAAGETKKDSKKDNRARAGRGFFPLLKRPTVVEGAVMGAIAGVLAGVIIGVTTGAVYPEPKKGVITQSVHHSRTLSAIGQGLVGFILGFATGTPIGAFIGLLGVYFKAESFADGWRRIVTFGVLIGAAVTIIVLDIQPIPPRHRYAWIPFGGGIGAVGALLWLSLQKWERSRDVPIVKDFGLEEEEKPAEAKAELDQLRELEEP